MAMRDPWEITQEDVRAALGMEPNETVFPGTMDQAIGIRDVLKARVLAAVAPEGEAEPVAWRYRTASLETGEWLTTEYDPTPIYDQLDGFQAEPLYLHPAPPEMRAALDGMREALEGIEGVATGQLVEDSYEATLVDIAARARSALTETNAEARP